MGLQSTTQKTYAIIISDGSIRVKADESDPTAVKRDYEVSNGKGGKTQGTKYEHVFETISGMIIGVNIFPGKFGETLNITFEDGKEIVLSIGTETPFAEDILQKLPNINFSKPVIFAPYSFTTKEGKLKKGVSITQENIKIQNFFYDFAKGESTGGMPTTPKPWGQMTKDEAKIFFVTRSSFLKNYIKENIIPVFGPIEERLKEAGIGEAESAPENQPELNSVVNNITGQTATVTPVNNDEVLKEISIIATTKLGATTPEEIKIKSMEATGLAFMDDNLVEILEALRKL